MKNECIFCRIIQGELPCYKLYEDKDFLAFLDIRPLTKGNALVVPKKHYRWTYDVVNFGKYFEIARKVGLAAKEAFNAEWICFLTLGFEVPHAHIRVIPRYKKDLHGTVVNPEVFEHFNPEQMEDIRKKILTKL